MVACVMSKDGDSKSSHTRRLYFITQHITFYILCVLFMYLSLLVGSYFVVLCYFDVLLL